MPELTDTKCLLCDKNFASIAFLGFIIQIQIQAHSDYTEYLRHTCVIQGGSNMTGTDLCVNKPHCAAAV